MSQHLTEAQIESYVARRASVDEIIAAAQHLDECFDCRDRAAALVDPGTDEIPHFRKGGDPVIPPSRSASRPLLPWVIGALLLIALLAWALIAR